MLVMSWVLSHFQDVGHFREAGWGNGVVGWGWAVGGLGAAGLGILYTKQHKHADLGYCNRKLF